MGWNRTCIRCSEVGKKCSDFYLQLNGNGIVITPCRSCRHQNERLTELDRDEPLATPRKKWECKPHRSKRWQRRMQRMLAFCSETEDAISTLEDESPSSAIVTCPLPESQDASDSMRFIDCSEQRLLEELEVFIAGLSASENQALSEASICLVVPAVEENDFMHRPGCTESGIRTRQWTYWRDR